MEVAEYHKRLIELGRQTQVLLQLHLEDPQEFDATRITEMLFDKFEELGLEGIYCDIS